MTVAIAIGATLFLGAFYSWTGRINGMFFFGRTAEREVRDSPKAREFTREYLIGVISTTAAAVLLAWFAGQFGRSFAAIGPLTEAVAFWAIFGRANRQVRALEVSHGTLARASVVQVPLFETPKYTVPALPVALLPAAVAALAFIAALTLEAPGTVGHGTDLRAAWGVWNASVAAHHLDTLVGMSLGLLSSATALLLLFRSSARLRTNMAQYTIRVTVLMGWAGLALLLVVLGCNYMGVSPAQHTIRTLIAIAVAAALGTVLWNQARAKRFTPAPIEMDADDRWRWGLFYVDRNDPALFVQSRCGAGYTLNYGRMLAWPISLAVVAYFVVLLFVPSHR